MIKEFAVEPSVMADWKHFRVLWDDFGVAKGRLISRYPKSWNKEVYELAHKMNEKPVRAKAICERIQQGKNRFVPSRRDYEPKSTWTENATGQMTKNPFHAIVAVVNPASHAAVLVAEELDREDARYKVKDRDKVPRTAEALAGCATLLIRESEELQIVDPYFEVTKRGFTETFKELMDVRRTSTVPLRVCELHTKRPESYDRSVQVAKYRRQLENAVPSGVTLRVHFWSQRSGGEKLHPRFLLTELGGIQFDYGLDEGEGEGDTTWVLLMEQSMWQTVRADYACSSGAFDITPDGVIEIAGKG